MDIVYAQLAQIRRRLGDIPALQKLEEKTNVPKEYAVLGAVISLPLFIEDGVLCDIIGFLYPAFKSFQALENRPSSGGTTQWIIYWMIYSFFSIIEVFINVLHYLIPFYYPFKLAFLLWAMMPQTHGAKFLYDCFLKDFLKKNESKIDAESEDATTSAGEVAVEATGAAGEAASALAISSLNISQYDALAATVKVKDVTSCANNRALVHRIKNNDPSLSYLSIASRLDPDDEGDFDFILGEGDDLGWLGYHIGRNQMLKSLYINLSADGDQTAALFNGLQRNESIKDIDLYGEVTLNEGFLKMNFPRITKMGLYGRHLREGLLYFARGLSKCRSLTVYEGIVTTEIAVALMSLPMLEEIHVSRGGGEVSVSQETCVELGKIVQKRKLKRLFLSGCGIGNKGLRLFAERLALTEGVVLKNLCLLSNNIGDEGVVALVKSLSQNRTLRILSLSLARNPSITENGMRAISQLLQSQKCSLDNLDLGGINIRDEGMKFLSCGLLGNRSIVSLSLARWDEISIGNDDIRVLTAGLKRNSHLRELDLSYNREITAAGIIHLGDYLHSPSCTLETLKIYGLRIGDEGAQALAEAVGGNTSLKRLLFTEGGITVTGWEAFSTLLANKSSPTTVYHSNHTLFHIGWTNTADVSRWLGINKYCEDRKLAMKGKILSCFPDLDMVPLFHWDLKLLPFVKAWFETVTSSDDDFRATIRNGEISAIYKFVRGMPLYVANESKHYYLSCQLESIQATKTKLREKIRLLSVEMKMLSAEMNSVEERERRLVQV